MKVQITHKGAPQPAPPALRRADRCDGCSAQARVRVSIPLETEELREWSGRTVATAVTEALPLDFCAHHYREHEVALAALGAKILADDRHLLLAR